MAQQAFLAQQRRRREHEGAHTRVFLKKRGPRKPWPPPRIVERMYGEYDRLGQLFDIWDADGDGVLTKDEFKRALMMIGIKATPEEVDDFYEKYDLNQDGSLSLDEILILIRAASDEMDRRARRSPTPTPALETVSPGRRLFQILFTGFQRCYLLLSSSLPQTVLYFGFVIAVQMLTASLRLKEEYYLDKSFNDVLLSNVFDQDLNRFENVRRPADVYRA